MHPVEHVLYFSAVLVHWVVPSHPIHAMYTLFHLAMAPVPGHSGFELIEVGGAAIATGGYAHYLHHKYFESTMPMAQSRSTSGSARSTTVHLKPMRP